MKNKRTFFLSLLCGTLLYGNEVVVDFGTHGQLYEIVEENGNDLIARSMKELNTTEIVESLIDDVQNSFTSRVNLPDSVITIETAKEDYVPSRWDIVDIDGRLIANKGDLIPSFLPSGVKLELCFINGNEHRLVNEYIINEFGKNCIYLVNNIDSRVFAENFKLTEVYPISKQVLDYLDRFNIKSLPTKITKETRFIKTKTIDIFSLRKKLLGGNR